MKSILLTIAGVAGIAIGVLASNARFAAERPDCPGKIECPITGEVICRDQCPLEDLEEGAEIAEVSAEPACCRRGD